jgi:hypothetical protein
MNKDRESSRLSDPMRPARKGDIFENECRILLQQHPFKRATGKFQNWRDLFCRHQRHKRIDQFDHLRWNSSRVDVRTAAAAAGHLNAKLSHAVVDLKGLWIRACLYLRRRRGEGLLRPPSGLS